MYVCVYACVYVCMYVSMSVCACVHFVFDPASSTLGSLLWRRGEILRNKRDFRAALASVEELVAVETSGRAYEQHLVVLRDLGMKDEAEIVLQQCLEAFPTHDGCLATRADMFDDLEDQLDFLDAAWDPETSSYLVLERVRHVRDRRCCVRVCVCVCVGPSAHQCVL